MFAASGLLEAGELATVIIALPVAVGLAWAIFKGIGHVQRVHEAIIGRPATAMSDPVPSMIERFRLVDNHLSTQDDRLQAIEKEYHPNGGMSMRDSANRNEKLTRETAALVEQHVASDEAIWHELTDKLLVISGGRELAAATALDVAVTVQKRAEAAASVVKQEAITQAATVRDQVVDAAAVVREKVVDQAAVVKEALDSESSAARHEAQAQADERDRVHGLNDDK
jgi:hypothetical protein